MPERDYTWDEEDWYRNNPYEWQGPPQEDIWSPQPGPQKQSTSIDNRNPAATTTTGGGMSEEEGREYDRRNNLIGGYMTPQGWVSGSPRQGGPGGTGDPSVMQSSYQAPAFNWQPYQMESFDPGPAFSYKEFVAPTSESMLKDPSFQFRLDQGRKALEASAAGKGVLRSGGTLKDVLGYGQNFASQEYGNIFNRSLQEYDTNRFNAADIWGKQYGQRRDVFDFRQRDRQFDWNAQQRQREYELTDDFNRWAKSGDWLTNLD